MDTEAPVAMIMGSRSDWPTMKAAARCLDELGVAWRARVISATARPIGIYAFAKGAAGGGREGDHRRRRRRGAPARHDRLADRRCRCWACRCASKTLDGLDSLLSIAQMPAACRWGRMAVGEAGARNAGLMAARILALSDPALAARLAAYAEAQTDAVPRRGRGLTRERRSRSRRGP